MDPKPIFSKEEVTRKMKRGKSAVELCGDQIKMERTANQFGLASYDFEEMLDSFYAVRDTGFGTAFSLRGSVIEIGEPADWKSYTSVKVDGKPVSAEAAQKFHAKYGAAIAFMYKLKMLGENILEDSTTGDNSENDRLLDGLI